MDQLLSQAARRVIGLAANPLRPVLSLRSKPPTSVPTPILDLLLSQAARRVIGLAANPFALL